MPANRDVARIQRKLTAIPKRVEKHIRDAMEKSADEIVSMMRRLVPIDDGNLRNSIGWSWNGAPDGASVMATSAPTQGGMVITIYAGGGDAFYAWFLEFGTVKMAAQPFFFPSYRTNEKRAAARIKRGVRKAVKEIWNGN